MERFPLETILLNYTSNFCRVFRTSPSTCEVPLISRAADVLCWGITQHDYPYVFPWSECRHTAAEAIQPKQHNIASIGACRSGVSPITTLNAFSLVTCLLSKRAMWPGLVNQTLSMTENSLIRINRVWALLVMDKERELCEENLDERWTLPVGDPF